MYEECIDIIKVTEYTWQVFNHFIKGDNLVSSCLHFCTQSILERGCTLKGKNLLRKAICLKRCLKGKHLLRKFEKGFTLKGKNLLPLFEKLFTLKGKNFCLKRGLPKKERICSPCLKSCLL